MTRSRLRALIIMSLVLVVDSTVVFAQACCTARGSQEFAVPGRCQQAVVAIQMGLEFARGSTSSDGRYRELSNGSAVDLTHVLGAGYRFSDSRLQGMFSIPFRTQVRDFVGAERVVNSGVGDTSVGVRYTVIKDAMTGIRHGWKPFFDIVSRLILPTGRGPSEGQARQMGADVHGEGVWGFGVGGLMSSYLTATDIVTLGGVYTRRVTADESTRYQHSLDGFVGYLRHITLRWSLGANLSFVSLFDKNQSALGDRFERRRVRISAQLSRIVVLPYWEVVAAVSVDPPFDHWSKNIAYAGIATTIAVKRSFF